MPAHANRVIIAKRLLSPALASVPNGGEGAGGRGADGTNFRKDSYCGLAGALDEVTGYG